MHVAEQHITRGSEVEAGGQPAQVDVAVVADLGTQQRQLDQFGEVGLEELHRHAFDAQAAVRKHRLEAELAFVVDRSRRPLAVTGQAVDARAELNVGR